jgi:hypothetical protein
MNILAKEKLNSFARMLDFRAIGHFHTKPPILAEKQAISFARIHTPPKTLSIIRPVSRTTASHLTVCP